MKHLIILFFATFASALMATVLPGLLNMNAARISVQKGKTNAFFYTLGVGLVVLIQAWIATRISRYLYYNPAVVDILLKIAIGVFAIFAVYFLISAKRSKEKPIEVKNLRKRNGFFTGLLLASLNLLTIPYYSGLHAAWNFSGWINFRWEDTLVFSVAGSLGTMAMLSMYIVYFNKLDTKSGKFTRYSDYILAGLMILLLAITFIRIVYGKD